MDDQLPLLKQSSDAAKKASDIASRTLQRSIESFRTDERAWVEIERIDTEMVAPKNGKFGAAYRYRLYPKNVGKTSAHNIVVNASRSMQTSTSFESNAENMRREQDSILFTLRRSQKSRPAVDNPIAKVLAPESTSVVPFVIDGQDPQIFPNDEWVSYLIGRIDYIDEFRVKHWMKFCYYVGEFTGKLWNCHEGNEEDHNAETPPE